MYTIEENKPLLGLNSFRIAATARRFVGFSGGDDLRAFFADLPATEKWYVLSGGNNVLLTGDYDGTILHPLCRDIAVERRESDSVLVRAGAGVEWDDFVAWAVEHGLGGVENLSAIPGYAGAAPVQNIGAYGAEVGDAVESVECFLTDERRIVSLSAEACRFGYRNSIFKHELRGRAVILSVLFRLSSQPRFALRYGDVATRVRELGGESLENIRRAVTDIRREKLPDPAVLGNAGSFFKNPVVPHALAARLSEEYPDMPSYEAGEGCRKLAAGWLIDRCGWKGRRVGPVGVHEKQALVLVNYGGATGADVLALADNVRSAVRTRFGVSIDMEVNLL